MIIASVVSSLSELSELLIHSFVKAESIGYKCVLITDVKLMLGGHSDLKTCNVIELEDFSSLGETNLSRGLQGIFEDEFVLQVDPDELYSSSLLEQIFFSESQLQPDSVIYLPFVYTFAGKVLSGTPWGGVRLFPRVAKLSKFISRTGVHSQLSGEPVYIAFSDNVVHFWANDFIDVRDKHSRYLKFEGEARFAETGSWVLPCAFLRLIRVFFGVVRRIRFSDGLNGARLSLEFLRYALLAELAHRNESLKYKSMILDSE